MPFEMDVGVNGERVAGGGRRGKKTVPRTSTSSVITIEIPTLRSRSTVILASTDNDPRERERENERERQSCKVPLL